MLLCLFCVAEIAWLIRLANGQRTKYEGDIFSTVYFPVYDSFDVATRKTVGVLRTVLHWARYFANVLPDTKEGLIVVLGNNCDTPYTYQINGKTVVPLGHGDLHDPKYNKYKKTGSFANINRIEDGTKEGMILHFDRCPYHIAVYPSDHMINIFTSNMPRVVTCSVAVVFLFAILMFFAYDRLVERRQRILLDKAKRTHMIVASLFPKNIQDQILDENGDFEHRRLMGAKSNLRSLVNGDMESNAILGQMPIADLYPETTVMVSSQSGVGLVDT